MALGLDLPSLLLAFGITVTEMTEVVALIFALGAEGGAFRPAAQGAVVGVAVVAGVAAVAGVGLERVPATALLAGASVVLFLFGLFLFRSTLRTYRRLRNPASPPPAHATSATPFAGGFAAGAVEATETVVVLIAIVAGGQATSALLGAALAGALLVGVAFLVHERVRRVKVPTLKLAATSALFAFSAFWGSEAAGVAWPGPTALTDLYLLPLFALSVLVVGALVRWRSRPPAPDGANR